MFVPTSKVPSNKNKLPRYLENLFQRRAVIWAKANESNKPEDWDHFETLNNKFVKKLNKYNSSVEKRIVESNNKNAFYRMLNIRLKRKPKLATLMREDGGIAASDEERAELLAEIFERSYSNVSDPAHISDEFELKQFPKMEDSAWFTWEEILQTIVAWPESTSLTPDHIPLCFIKGVAHVIVKPLEMIFNLSLMNAACR
ncbi:hypothetical protein Y032_0576g214 [Ancylostoma ceylanicum]|uniref:Uncharacterized protein n=1 Tax=Ancylostoma ceylanicum TaxID=53326 RepID=A0A016WNQ7_9BILA|nr:hypothetical protein Y032_0576g214 [Ancylostoma ceylanicum]